MITFLITFDRFCKTFGKTWFEQQEIWSTFEFKFSAIFFLFLLIQDSFYLLFWAVDVTSIQFAGSLCIFV